MHSVRPILLLASMACPLLADELHLAGGGRLIGGVQEVRDEGGPAYQLELPGGIRVELAGGQVDRVVRDSPARAAYLARAAAAPDSAVSQLALAKWCREQKLADEFELHLGRVLQLDPENAEAHALLEHRKVGDVWMTRQEHMSQRGLVWYEGAYRTRQDIALRKRAADVEAKQAEWTSQARLMRRWLDDRNSTKSAQAVAWFREVADPLAAKAVIDLLEKERHPNAKQLLLAAAARIPHQATVDALVVVSLDDPDADCRQQALDALVASQRPGLAEPYVKALGSNDNAVVNRAALALAALKQRDAIGPLIDALVTKHKRMVGNTSGGDSYSFSPTSGGFSFGGNGPKVIEREVRNPEVLTALSTLSGGESFGYDQATWKKWLATQGRIAQVNLRRAD